MAIYVRVVESRSFTTAAAKLGLGKSVISQHIRALEEGLGTRLIHRNTRSFRLTDDGDIFFNRCVVMLEAAEAAVEAIGSGETVQKGIIRITAPHNLGLMFVVGLVHRFRKVFPGIKVDLALDDAVVNIIEEQVDVAIRVGPLRDSTHRVVKLSSYELVLCAGRSFADGQLPKIPEDLVNVPWIELHRASIGNRVTLIHADGSTKTVKVYPQINTNSGLAAQAFIGLGEGIGILPNYAVRAEMKNGSLIRILPEWSLPSANISAVFASNRISARLRLFVEFAQSEFKTSFASA
jgi:DNA-binding transcriptional LysR family regulator